MYAYTYLSLSLSLYLHYIDGGIATTWLVFIIL